MLKKPVLLIVLLGFILRVLFMLFFAEIYFGRESIHVDGDTGLWTSMFENWWNLGIFSSNLTHEYGYFTRTPGYSFFIGFIWLLTGKDWLIAFKVIAWAQLLMDVLAVYLMYRIGFYLFKNKTTALICGLLYAIYPFTVVWNPVVYSEALSISSLIIGCFFLFRNNKYDLIGTGAFISLAVLCRPQLLPLLGLISIYLLIMYRSDFKLFLHKAILYTIPVILVYGSWPIRNYINYNKIIPTQDLRSLGTAGEDWLAFTEYVYSVKAEWEPQFSDLIHNKKVTFPPEAYTIHEDSIKLEHAIYLSQNCASSFSSWDGYWKERFSENDPNCNDEVIKLFKELKQSQIKNNPLNFYVIVPLKNLKKALFKLTLYKPSSVFVGIIGSLLFIFRTIMILLGISGGILLLKNGNDKNLLGVGMIFIYFVLLYLILCAGTAPQMRDIEMRYFVQADILMLLPAAYCINFILSKLNLLKPQV